MNSEVFLEFEDILQRHQYKFDVLFAFKPYQPWDNVLNTAASNSFDNVWSSRQHPNIPSGDEIKEKVLKSAALDHAIRALRLEQQNGSAGDIRSEDDLRKEARLIADLMAHNQTISWARIAAGSVYWVLKRTYNNIFVNTAAFDQIKDLFNKGPIVFLPSHRSYMDFLLVSIILFCYDLPIPVIAAAIDFLGMKFVGELLRRCGAFFIRRSFKSNKLYWTIFYEYVQTHLHASKFPIEFFIEGTRSRTGNFLYPKSGMLNVVCQDYFKGKVTDVFFVPVSISYERVLEETLYAFEIATGLPKPKESTSGLLKARKILDENFGNIYVQFGQPFSLREAAINHVDRSVFSCTPLFEEYVSHESELFVQQLSLYAIGKIQENIYIQPWHLVASALLNNTYETSNRGIAAMHLVEKVNVLSQLLNCVHAKQVLTSYTLTDVLNAIKCHQNTVQFYNFSKTFLLCPENVSNSTVGGDGKFVQVIPVQLLIYQNMFINYLAPLFMAIKVIERNENVDGCEQSIFSHLFSQAVNLFGHEFVFVQHDPQKVLKHLEALEIVSVDTTSHLISLNPINNSRKCLDELSQPYFAITVVTIFILKSLCGSSEHNEENTITHTKFEKLVDLSSYIRLKLSQYYDSGNLTGASAVTTVSVNNVLSMCKSRSVLFVETMSNENSKSSCRVCIDVGKCCALFDQLLSLFICDSYMFVKEVRNNCSKL